MNKPICSKRSRPLLPRKKKVCLTTISSTWAVAGEFTVSRPQWRYRLKNTSVCAYACKSIFKSCSAIVAWPGFDVWHCVSSGLKQSGVRLDLALLLLVCLDLLKISMISSTGCWIIGRLRSTLFPRRLLLFNQKKMKTYFKEPWYAGT